MENALRVMSVLPKEKTAPHLDRLLYWLGNEEWWLQHAAIGALAPLAADERYYKKIMPKLTDMMVNNTHAPATSSMRAFTGQLKTANPKVQEAALKMFAKAYADFPSELHPLAGDAAVDQLKGDMKKSVVPGSLKYIAGHMMAAPGGYSSLFEVAKKRHPEQALPYKKNYLLADITTFTPEVREAMKPVFLEQLVPEFITRKLGALRGEMTRGGAPNSRLAELAGLHKQAGVNDYVWSNFGPDRNEMTFHYYMGDTKEQKDWNKAGFDPAKSGWKVGMAPFGEDGGKLRTEQSGCANPICRCGDPMNTLWNKGNLLITGKFKFPKMKEGHSYRLLISGASHVGMSGNVTAFINGRSIASTRGAVRRGKGGRPRGSLIPQNLVAAFQGQEVTISASCSPRTHKWRKGNFVTIWIEEMRCPPVTDELAWQGLSQIAMQSSEWQQAQDTDVAEMISGEGLFSFDGKFVSNEKLLGTWKPIGKVAAIDDFKPGVEIDKARPRYSSITFKDKGFTDSTARYWSGDTLMEVSKSTALKMKTKTIDGADYLFVEAGGFTHSYERQTYKHPRTWKSPWFVLKR